MNNGTPAPGFELISDSHATKDLDRTSSYARSNAGAAEAASEIGSHEFGVIGFGVLGKALVAGYERNGHQPLIYDPNVPHFNEIHPALCQCLAIAIAVPTQPGPDGYDLREVKSALNLLARIGYRGVVVVVSTIGPRDVRTLEHFARQLYARYSIAVSPEFLTEANASADFYGQRVVYFGSVSTSTDDIELRRCLEACRGGGVQLRELSAEQCCLIKTHRNLALALKLTSANLAYLEAVENGLDAEQAQGIVDAVFDDPRLHSQAAYHTVGNSEGTMGFAGKCLEKDLAAKASGIADSVSKDLLAALLRFNQHARRHVISIPSCQS
ncbi:MAG: hypothetical protein HYX47_01980 [Burkholderiales bacterium]|nr:hypothetical protein [Burkholderiales bacterium]